jgi:hypothetical protein
VNLLHVLIARGITAIDILAGGCSVNPQRHQRFKPIPPRIRLQMNCYHSSFAGTSVRLLENSSFDSEWISGHVDRPQAH